jgi:hypothetical protein
MAYAGPTRRQEVQAGGDLARGPAAADLQLLQHQPHQAATRPSVFNPFQGTQKTPL